VDLSAFARWWSQAGTPRVRVAEAWEDGRYTLVFSQSTPPTPGQPEKAPVVIPVRLGLLGADGRELVPERVVTLEEGETRLSFDLPERPVPSILRGFSAPVVLERESTDEERAFLLAHDPDPFNRWQAGRGFAVSIALRMLDGETEPPAVWTDALGRVLADDTLDPAFRALCLEVPGNDEIAGEVAGRGGAADPQAIHRVLTAMRARLGGDLGEALTGTYAAMTTEGPYSPDAAHAARRALRNRCLALLMAAGGEAGAHAAEAQFDHADNMTDRLAALATLVHHDAPGARARLDAFHDAWAHDSLVLDKWFSVQASAPVEGILDRVKDLTGLPAFSWKTPNRFRSVVAVFAMGNPVGFHAPDGAGYRFVADWIIRLDPVNPQTAARVVSAFESWRRYTPALQALMKGELQRIAATEGLSRNTAEMVGRMLAER
jgi:aminopeptidase N